MTEVQGAPDPFPDRSPVALRSIYLRHKPSETLGKWISTTETCRRKSLQKAVLDFDWKLDLAMYMPLLNICDWIPEITLNIRQWSRLCVFPSESKYTSANVLRTNHLAGIPIHLASCRKLNFSFVSDRGLPHSMLAEGVFGILRHSKFPLLRVLNISIVTDSAITPKDGHIIPKPLLPFGVAIFNPPHWQSQRTRTWNVPPPVAAQLEQVNIEFADSRGLISEVREWGTFVSMFGRAGQSDVMQVKNGDIPLLD
jgi:hypothetical protein